MTLALTTCKLPEDRVLTPKHVGVILTFRHRASCIRGLLEKYPTFGREKETGLLGALDT